MTTTPGPAPAQPGTALAVLAAVAVKGRAPLTGYAREQFGPPWTDVNHNGCDTRDDILAAQLTHVRTDGRCRVVSGSEADPYTNVSLYYVRGRSTVDIDHVVALGDAWQTGAQQLSVTTRTAFANDPLNLLAVSLAANRAKGDADAASWLPKQRSYRCAYVARQVAVKARYHLWMTRAEHVAIASILARCPTQAAPTAGSARNHMPWTAPTPTHTSAPTTSHPKTQAPTPSRPPTQVPTTTTPPAPVAVHPGSYCAPEGATGVTSRGTSMVCGPASDGRNRWHHG